jgi:hypothetical protein
MREGLEDYQYHWRREGREVGILFLGYKERGGFSVTGYGKSGSERMDEGGGATTQSNLWNQAGNCVYKGGPGCMDREWRG